MSAWETMHRWTRCSRRPTARRSRCAGSEAVRRSWRCTARVEGCTAGRRSPTFLPTSTRCGCTPAAPGGRVRTSGGPGSFADDADDLQALLDEITTTTGSPVHVLGGSYGASVALHAALADAPERPHARPLRAAAVRRRSSRAEGARRLPRNGWRTTMCWVRWTCCRRSPASRSRSLRCSPTRPHLSRRRQLATRSAGCTTSRRWPGLRLMLRGGPASPSRRCSCRARTAGRRCPRRCSSSPRCCHDGACDLAWADALRHDDGARSRGRHAARVLAAPLRKGRMGGRSLTDVGWLSALLSTRL